MSKTLFVLNEQPYGGERSYNGLRMATALVKAEGEEVRVFLISEAVTLPYAAPAWTHEASVTLNWSRTRIAAR